MVTMKLCDWKEEAACQDSPKPPNEMKGAVRPLDLYNLDRMSSYRPLAATSKPLFFPIGPR